MKYTIDTLREINARFCGSHILVNYDVDKANMYVELIENTRSEKIPSVGDCFVSGCLSYHCFHSVA